MKRAFVISPYAGDTKRNIAFANKAMHFCFASGYAPFAGHILYAASGLLDDRDLKDRDFGMQAAYAFLAVCDIAFCFMDLHVSTGMRVDLDAARRLKVKIDYVTVSGAFPTVDALHNLSLPHEHMPCATCQIEKERT
jgi:hypothetical protein